MDDVVVVVWGVKMTNQTTVVVVFILRWWRIGGDILQGRIGWCRSHVLAPSDVRRQRRDDISSFLYVLLHARQ